MISETHLVNSQKWCSGSSMHFASLVLQFPDKDGFTSEYCQSSARFLSYPFSVVGSCKKSPQLCCLFAYVWLALFSVKWRFERVAVDCCKRLWEAGQSEIYRLQDSHNVTDSHFVCEHLESHHLDTHQSWFFVLSEALQSVFTEHCGPKNCQLMRRA